MKKKIWIAMICVLAITCIGLAGCGDKSSDKKDSKQPKKKVEKKVEKKEYGNTCVTKDMYDNIPDDKWPKMTVEDFNEYFDCEGKLNKERTDSWGPGYKVYEWPGDKENSGITILFKDKDKNGKYLPSSISPYGFD